MCFFPELIRRILRIRGCNSFADENVGEWWLGDLIGFIFLILLLFALNDDFLIEFSDDVGSIHVEVGGIFDFGEESTVVIFAFALKKYFLVDH